MTAFWAYCRVSTTKDEQELSLEDQAAWAREFAREHGARLQVVEERASAKTTIGRPKFNQMMSELSILSPKSRPQYLLVTALDRLSRSTRDTLNVIEALRELKITLYQRGLGPVTVEDFPRLAALVGMSLAGEAENYGRSIRMKQSWAKRRAEGKPTSNKVPYGLQLLGGRDILIPESAAWVLKAFQWYASGDVGMYTIARRFADGAPEHTWLTSRIDENGERIRKTRKATKWEANRIRKLLEMKRYRGTAVPIELFDKVQRRLAQTPRTGSQRVREYPLTAAMVCEGCGRHLHGVASGGYKAKKMPGGKSIRVHHPEKRVRYYECYICRYRLNAVSLEETFFTMIGSVGASEAALKQWVTAPKSQIRASLRSELAKLERETTAEVELARVDKAFDLALRSELSPSQVRHQMDRIREEFAAKRARITELQDQIDQEQRTTRTLGKARDLLSNFRPLYNHASYEGKREMLAALVQALGGLKVCADGLIWARSGPAAALAARAR